MTTTAPESLDFIRTIVTEDVRTSRHAGRVATRFPPEPNGYLHIGHAKSICLNFGVAREFGGSCNLRFDDTNPAKEDVEYVDSIKADVQWLGFDWTGLLYASDYFEALYGYAQHLIRAGLAYVDGLTPDEIREYRGTLTEPGSNSPFRDRPVAENLDLFARMRAGEFADGAQVLRAKIDMASPNINLRDPVLYRIRRSTHHRTGDAWCIYPMYDYAHPISDAIENITHSLCTLEFEDHRPLYDWLLANLPVPSRPQQIEFARLNLTYTVMSKRKLLQLVDEKHVAGWDDPRMPTLVGLRRRGYTPEALRDFCERVGVAKNESIIDVALLEHCVREDLNRRAPRVLAVLRPLKVIIENLPEGEVEHLEAVNNPEDPAAGTRKIPFTREIYIEQDDFREKPPKKYFRLSPGKEVRLRYGYIIKCVGVDKAADGTITELRCTYDPDSKGARRGHQARQGDDPLGLRGARPSRRGAALRPPVHERAAGRRRHRLPRPRSTRTRSRWSATASSSRPRRRRAGDALPVRAPRLLRRRSRTRRPIAWSSTARSRCATSGRRSTRARRPDTCFLREASRVRPGARDPPAAADSSHAMQGGVSAGRPAPIHDRGVGRRPRRRSPGHAGTAGHRPYPRGLRGLRRPVTTDHHGIRRACHACRRGRPPRPRPCCRDVGRRCRCDTAARGGAGVRAVGAGGARFWRRVRPVDWSRPSAEKTSPPSSQWTARFTPSSTTRRGRRRCSTPSLPPRTSPACR